MRVLQKTLGSVLLVAWIAAPCYPALNALVSPGSKSYLPACCRRDGKHRCTTSIYSPTKNRTLGVPRQRCPLFPKYTAGIRSTAGSLFVSSGCYAPLATAVPIEAKIEAVHRAPPSRFPPKTRSSAYPCSTLATVSQLSKNNVPAALSTPRDSACVSYARHLGGNFTRGTL